MAIYTVIYMPTYTAIHVAIYTPIYGHIYGHIWPYICPYIWPYICPYIYPKKPCYCKKTLSTYYNVSPPCTLLQIWPFRQSCTQVCSLETPSPSSYCYRTFSWCAAGLEEQGFAPQNSFCLLQDLVEWLVYCCSFPK